MLTTLMLLVACDLPGLEEAATRPDAWQTRPDLPATALDRLGAPQATAVLEDREGDRVGTVSFIDSKLGVAIHGELRGLEPGSVHAVHVHEHHDCGSPTEGYQAAGGHYAPEGHEHGGPHDPDSHAGDLGNVVADDDGVARLEMETHELSVYGDDAVFDRTVVMHAEADDLNSQPAGDAGPRQACGEIDPT